MSKGIEIPRYRKLVKFGTGNGSPSMIGTVIGVTDDAVIRKYLAHMQATDSALYKKWGSKWAPEEDEDMEDPTANLEDDDEQEEALPPPPVKKQKKAEATKGLDTLMADDEPPVPAKPAVPVGSTVIDGRSYPDQFKLRGANGLDTPLEVFSKSEKWGVILRVPVPTDMRKVLLPGGEVELDLLALRRDPDGMTTLNGKKYSNSKLIAAAELGDD